MNAEGHQYNTNAENNLVHYSIFGTLRENDACLQLKLKRHT